MGTRKRASRTIGLLSALGVLGVGALTLGGCFVGGTGGYYVADVGPPPPRTMVVVARPGYVWIDGRWTWDGGGWAWSDGYWVQERPGYAYTQGYWVRRGGHHHWVDGSWRVAHGTRQGYHPGRRTYVQGRGRGAVRAPASTVRDHRGGQQGVAPAPRSTPAPRARTRDHRR